MRRAAAALAALLAFSTPARAQLAQAMFGPCVSTGTSTSTPKFVQGIEAAKNSAATPTYTVTLNAVVASGDTVVGGVTYDTGSSEAISSIKDDQNNVYTVLKTVNDAGVQQSTSMFSGGPFKNNPKTITITWTVNQPSGAITAIADEFSGLSGTLDVTTGQVQTNPGNTANSTTSGSATTTVAGDLIYGNATQIPSATASWVAGTGFTLTESAPTGAASLASASEFEVQGAAGAVAATFSPATGAETVTIMIAMAPATTSTSACYQQGAPPANTFFVATNGSDSNPGTLAQPFLTIGKAQAAMQAGSIKTTTVRAGTYSVAATINLTSADNGETFQYYTPDGVDTAIFDGGSSTSTTGVSVFTLNGVSNVTLNGFLVRNCQQWCFGVHGGAAESNVGFPLAVANSSGVIIENMILDGSHTSGVSGWAGGGVWAQGNVQNLTITNNVAQNHDGSGFRIDADPDTSTPSDSITGLKVTNNVALNTNRNVGDNGAIYVQDNTFASTNILIQNNFVRDYQGVNGFNTATARDAAIYFDRGAGNGNIVGNVIAPTANAITTAAASTQAFFVSGPNNNFHGNIVDLGRVGNILDGAIEQYQSGDNVTGNFIQGNIYIGNWAGGQTSGFFGVSNVGFSTGGAATATVQNNIFHNYGSGTLSQSCCSTGGSTPDPLLQGYLYQVSAGSPAFNSPVNFPPIAGGYGPPGYVVPATGTGPSFGGAADPTTTQTFNQALIGYSISQQYQFGTSASGGAPVVPLTSMTSVGNFFNPKDSRGTFARNGEWQTFATTFTDTSSFNLTPNSIKLNCWNSGPAVLASGNFTCGQLVWKTLIEPGVTPAGQHFLAGEMVAKIPNAGGAQPAFWCFQAAPATSGGPNELDWEEGPVSTNGVWSVNTWVDGTGITPSSLESTIFNDPRWDGFKVNVSPTDLSAGFHKYEFIWTPRVLFVYLDGALMRAFNYSYTNSSACEVMLYNTVGDQGWGQPMNPTSLGEFPYALEIQTLTFWSAP